METTTCCGRRVRVCFKCLITVVAIQSIIETLCYFGQETTTDSACNHELPVLCYLRLPNAHETLRDIDGTWAGHGGTRAGHGRGTGGTHAGHGGTWAGHGRDMAGHGRDMGGTWRDKGGTWRDTGGTWRDTGGTWRDTGGTRAGHDGTLAGHRRDTGRTLAGHGPGHPGHGPGHPGHDPGHPGHDPGHDPDIPADMPRTSPKNSKLCSILLENIQYIYIYIIVKGISMFMPTRAFANDVWSTMYIPYTQRSFSDSCVQ